MKMIFLIFSLLCFNSFASDIGVTYITVGGGYPLGLVIKLNSQFEDAFNQTNSAFGYTGAKETLTKTYSAGSFSANIGIGKQDSIINLQHNFNWFLMLGYSVNGTKKAKWSSTFSDGKSTYKLGVSGRYAMHDIRFLPVFWTAYTDAVNNPRAFGIGAGGVYSIVKYSQTSENNVPNSMQLPDISTTSSGFAWCLYGFWKFSELVGIEVSSSGKNLFYAGLFICGVLFGD
jgi:hypothetical protein